MNKECKYEKIKNFLNQIESNLREPIVENYIYRQIEEFIKQNFKESLPTILLWEHMAFAFIEKYQKYSNNSRWGTYFGPRFVLQNEEGTYVEYPRLQKITSEVISYWEKRAIECNHPVFKARYSNLVWDFSEKIKGKRPHYSIAQIFIDSVIEITEKNLHKYFVDVINKLERALSLALIINDKERINKLTKTLISYEKKIAEDDKPDLWGFSYKLLVKNKKVKLDKEIEQKIIKDLEERFKRLLKQKNQWAARYAVLLLEEYYKSKNLSKVKNILLKFGVMIQKHINQASPLVASVCLEELYHLYLKHNLRNEANKILNRIMELGKESKSELKKIEISIETPKEKLLKYINWLIEDDFKTALTKIAINYIPRKDDIKKQLQNLFKKTPIFFLFPYRRLDNKGRVIATVDSLENDIDGHIVLQISRNMQISSFFLRETISALINKFNLNTKKLVEYFYESPIFDERRKEFFIRGIESYLNRDFLVALHILIPQIEALIRNLAEKIGIPILKHSRYGGYFYRTLDELLREEGIIKVLGEDMCLYLRVLLTDSRGWNLRNNLCHGISKIENFNQITADRVFHVLLCLSLVRKI